MADLLEVGEAVACIFTNKGEDTGKGLLYSLDKIQCLAITASSLPAVPRLAFKIGLFDDPDCDGQSL